MESLESKITPKSFSLYWWVILSCDLCNHHL